MRKFPLEWPKSAGKYLYHYTRAATALTKILPTATIRAGSFLDMNDPREAKSWSFSSPEWEPGRVEDQAKCEAQNLQIREDALVATKLAQECTRVVCFSEDDPDRQPASRTDHPLGRGFSHSAMWSHYADGHSGVCLIFDKARLSSAIEAWLDDPDCRIKATGWMYEGAVEYKDREDENTFLRGVPRQFEPGGRSLRMETLSHVGRYHRELFFEKSLDWKYEKEYRYIFWGEGSEALTIPFGNSLCGVVVGENFGKHPDLGDIGEPCFNRTLDLHCRKFQVKSYQLWWQNGIPFMAPRTKRRW